MDQRQINYDLVEATLEMITKQEEAEGAILVFLPGMPEITKMHDTLRHSAIFGDDRKFLVLPLHSSLSTQEHQRVFVPAPRGVQKIVLSTNIAETGVTLPDVVYVVDCGRVKQQRYRESTGMSSLVDQFISSGVDARGACGRGSHFTCSRSAASRTCSRTLCR